MTYITKSFRIIQTASGADLGVFEATTRGEALDFMAQDAGYDDYESMCEVAPAGTDTLKVIEV